MTDHANELRRYSRKIGHPAGDVPSVMLAAADEIERLAARLEAAEKERDALRNEIACVKEVEFPRKAQAVADAWKGKCKRLEAERDALHAKIEQMEKQEPAGYGVLYVEAANGEEDWDSLWKHRVFAEDHVKDFVQAHSELEESVGAITVVPLYLAPGAKGEEK